MECARLRDVIVSAFAMTLSTGGFAQGVAPTDPAGRMKGDQRSPATNVSIRVRDEVVALGARAPLAPQIRQAIAARRAAAAGADPRAHALLVFSRPPSKAERDALAQAGAGFLERLDETAWIASLTTQAAARVETSGMLRWAGLVEPRVKLAATVNMQTPYRWQARPGGRIAMAVRFYSDVTPDEVVTLASRLGATLEGFDRKAFRTVKGLIVPIAPGQLDALVGAEIVQYVEPAPAPDEPTNRLNTQPLSRVDQIQNVAPYNLTGAGVTVGVWEATDTATNSSIVRDTHLDLTPRVTRGAGQATSMNFSDHATHVAGTIAASGANIANAEGMATGASVTSWDSASDATEMTNAATSAGGAGNPTPIQISNHSYGIGIGWNDAGSLFNNNLASFGAYDTTSQNFDDVVANDGLITFVSAGNDRNDSWDGATADWDGDGAANAPGTAPVGDCRQGGLAVDATCIGPRASAKNVVTVGAMDNAAVIMGFSSFGPTLAGRIKPDLVAHGGFDTLSTIGTADNASGTMGGTSMATPAVSGIAALLLEQANTLGVAMPPAAMKALLVQTAIDVTGVGQSAPGPDYATGWGIANSQAAADLLRLQAGPGLATGSVANEGASGAVDFPVFVADGLAEAHVTIAWADPSGAAIQNDLDLRLTDPNGTVFTPWGLDPANPGAAAVRNGGDEATNNVEQVSVLNPVGGIWRATVSADTGTLTSTQNFAIAGPLTGFGILAPTQTFPAYAGTSMFGSRVLVRVAGGSGLSLAPANLQVSVDGTALTAAQIPTSGVVGGETWLIIAPGPKPNGCYPLQVTLAAPAGFSDTETASLCYEDDEVRAFDRVIAIDQTQSMNYNGITGNPDTEKMDSARAAAQFFVDLSNDIDKISVVAFQRRDENSDGSIGADEMAEVVFPLTQVLLGGADQRPAARTAAQNVTPDTSPGFTGPETSIGSGLEESRGVLDGSSSVGAERSIVLLTDGLENYPPYWGRDDGAIAALRPSFAGGITRIDTVGVGPDADSEVLTDMATSTEGKYINLLEGAGSYALLSRLASYYKSLDEDVRGEQRFFYAEGFPKLTSSGTAVAHQVEYREGSFVAEPGMDWMTVAFHANLDDAFTVALFAPGSSMPIAVAPPVVTRHDNSKHVVYRIRTPLGGVWRYRTGNENLSAEFLATASGPTLLAARLGPNQLRALPTGDYRFPIRLWIADTAPVLGATASGYVRRPDGFKVPVALSDDGAHNDGAANDGIYGLDFTAAMKGAYFVSLEAHGTSNRGEPFERFVITAFVLPNAPKKPNQYGEGLPPVVPGRGGCGCEPNAERPWTLSALVGINGPTGSFDMIADGNISFGLKLERLLTSQISLGAHLGHDRFKRAQSGGHLSYTHLSPELQFTPFPNICPKPAVHVGAGAYADQSGNFEFGYNVGASIRWCISDRIGGVVRYDYRAIPGPSHEYSVVQVGLRFSF